jgi:hypothetical protein
LFKQLIQFLFFVIERGLARMNPDTAAFGFIAAILSNLPKRALILALLVMKLRVSRGSEFDRLSALRSAKLGPAEPIANRLHESRRRTGLAMHDEGMARRLAESA